MILSKDDMAALNHFATEAGGDAVVKLGKIAYDYFAYQTVIGTADSAGAAKFAIWLQALPKALRERQN